MGGRGNHFSGATKRAVIPAKAGITLSFHAVSVQSGTPAFAGVTPIKVDVFLGWGGD